MHKINIFGGEKGIVKCADRGWSVVIRPKFSDQLSWKWRQQTSKSAMFLASLACLKNDRSTSSSYFTAQCVELVGHFEKKQQQKNAGIYRYTTRERDIWKIRHSGPGCSGVWILRVF